MLCYNNYIIKIKNNIKERIMDIKILSRFKGEIEGITFTDQDLFDAIVTLLEEDISGIEEILNNETKEKKKEFIEILKEVFRSNVSEDGFDGVKDDILEDLNAGNEIDFEKFKETESVEKLCDFIKNSKK